MKKIFTCFLLYGIMGMMMSSCQPKESNSSLLEDSDLFHNNATQSLQKDESDTSEIIMQFNNLSADVAITCDPEVKISDISIDGYWLIFSYEVGILQGQAHVRLSYGRLPEYTAGEINQFINYMSLVFHYDREKTSLTVNWSGNDYESADTYILDEKANLWYYLWPDLDISFVSLTEPEAIQHFPNHNIYTNKYYDTFLCDKLIYDVSFYRVSDFDNIYGPDVLLAHYDEYTNDNLFFWQTDEMYSWHISIQYTDTMGDTHFVSYINKNYASPDPTLLVELDKPDWNTNVEGKVYSEIFQ